VDGLGLSSIRTYDLLPYVSGGTCSFQVLGGGDLSYGFGVLDFAYEDVKWAVGWYQGFLYTIASPACKFLYLNNEYMI